MQEIDIQIPLLELEKPETRIEVLSVAVKTFCELNLIRVEDSFGIHWLHPLYEIRLRTSSAPKN